MNNTRYLTWVRDLGKNDPADPYPVAPMRWMMANRKGGMPYSRLSIVYAVRLYRYNCMVVGESGMVIPEGGTMQLNHSDRAHSTVLIVEVNCSRFVREGADGRRTDVRDVFGPNVVNKSE